MINSEKLKEIIKDSDSLILLESDIVPKLEGRKYLVKCNYCGRIYESGSPSGNNCLACEIKFKCNSCNWMVYFK